jgi:hypothetical protein
MFLSFLTTTHEKVTTILYTTWWNGTRFFLPLQDAMSSRLMLYLMNAWTLHAIVDYWGWLDDLMINLNCILSLTKKIKFFNEEDCRWGGHSVRQFLVARTREFKKKESVELGLAFFHMCQENRLGSEMEIRDKVYTHTLVPSLLNK